MDRQSIVEGMEIAVTISEKYGSVED